jgi:N-methylhydantoinase B
LCDYVASGGGYGDPLDRDPEKVARDVKTAMTSAEIARRIYGVVMDGENYSVDRDETESLRRQMRQQRISEASLLGRVEKPPNGALKRTLRIHEYLEIGDNGYQKFIRCIRCGYVFCDAKNNYKKYSLRRIVPLNLVARYPLPSRAEYLGHYHEYICPGCATLLQVDLFCPALGGAEDLWDIRIDLAES